MSSTRLSYLAVKRQATDNVAVIPTHFLRYREGDIMLKQEVIMNDPIQNNRWKSLQAIQGKITCDGTYKFDLDANECVHWFAAGLGTLVTADISSATDASAFSQTIDFAASLPILCIEQGKGDLTDTTNNRQNYSVERAYGTYVDEFQLAANDKLITMTVKVKALGVREKASVLGALTASASPVVISVDSAEGFVIGETVNIYDATPQNETKVPSALSLTANPNTLTVPTLTNSYTLANKPKVELTPQTPSFSVAPQVFSFAHVNFQFGADLTAAAAAAETNIENWDLSFMNHLEERFGSIRNSPGVIAPKGAQAKLKFTKYFKNVADRDAYLSITRQACIMTITNNVVISATDTGTKKYQVQIKLNDLRFHTYEMPTATDALYAVKVEAEALYNATDGKALQIIVQNASAGTVYTA